MVVVLFDAQLPGRFSARHHRDPFDRMLVAQAPARDLTLVSRDPALSPDGVKMLKA